ncbi:MAG: PQQ-like beta-propeller repeat protein [Verrucomicrobia bacterium]|nr:PQQ-like beta-propeller repeat protein [Verrucomicrobiota bacterium]
MSSPPVPARSFRPLALARAIGAALLMLAVLPLHAAAPAQNWYSKTDSTATSSVVSSPAIGPDGVVYVGVKVTTTAGNGRVIAFNPDGTVKWTCEAPTDWVESTPAVAADGTVYVGSWDGNLYAINGETGAVKWQFATGAYIYSSPAIGPDGTVYVGSGDLTLHAVSPLGVERWQRPAGDWVDSSPAVGVDGSVYYGSWDNYIYGLNADGTEKWRLLTGAAVVSSPAIAPDGTVYCGSSDGSLYAIRPGGALKWSYPTGDAIESSPVLGADGTVYVGSNDGYFYALNPGGTLKWRTNIGRPVATTATVRADGSILFAADDNKLHALGADGTEQWSFAFGSTADSADCSPAVAPDGTIYAGSVDGFFYALRGGVAPLASYWPMFRHDARRTGLVAPLVITGQPQGHTLAAGATAVLAVSATGTGLTYQWNKDGVPVAGATSARLVLTGVQGTAGYTVTLGNQEGASVTSSVATLVALPATDPGHLINLSIRGTAGTGNKVLIMGFVTGGAGAAGSTPLLIRGVGPSIMGAPFNVTDALADPVIEIVPADSTASRTGNDDWGGTDVLKQAALTTGAFALASDTSKDAALLGDFPGGVYSVIVSGKNGTTGAVLAEIYDARPAGQPAATLPRLINISARGYVGASDTLIAGFVISGQTAKTVLIRAVGPDPAFAAAVANGNLSDPMLYIYQSVAGVSSVILTNDNWGGDPQLTAVGTAVGAAPLSVPASKDAVVLATLDPGVYTALAAGMNGAAGITLVEIYDVP